MGLLQARLCARKVVRLVIEGVRRLDKLLLIVVGEVDVLALECLQVPVQAQDAHFEVAHDVRARGSRLITAQLLQLLGGGGGRVANRVRHAEQLGVRVAHVAAHHKVVHLLPVKERIIA